MAKISVTQDVLQEEKKLSMPEIRVWCHPNKGSDFYEEFDSFDSAMAFIEENEDNYNFWPEKIPLVAFDGLEINLWSIKTENKVDPAELQPQDEITDVIFDMRNGIKLAASGVKDLADILGPKDAPLNEEADRGEMIANVKLAYRHLEDAAMRLGKVMQAKNGGESILSK